MTLLLWVQLFRPLKAWFGNSVENRIGRQEDSLHLCPELFLRKAGRPALKSLGIEIGFENVEAGERGFQIWFRRRVIEQAAKGIVARDDLAGTAAAQRNHGLTAGQSLHHGDPEILF